MRRILPLLLVAPLAFAAPGLGAVHVGLGNGQYTAPANDWYCGGRTYTLQLELVVAGDEGLASIYARSGLDCQDVWPEMHVRGSFAQGFEGFCTELPTPCVLLTMAPLVHGGQTAIRVDGPNVGVRSGFVVLP